MRVLSILKVLPCVLIALSSIVAAAPGRNLTLSERIAAQRALDRAYYGHQIGTTKPFEEAVPIDLTERKVRTYLKQSEALETIWHDPLSAERLREETERITRRTRMPGRLRELFDALGGDPVRIQECLVRPALVERLARERFASDSGLRSDPRWRGNWDLWWGEVGPTLEGAPVETIASSLPLSPIAGDSDGLSLPLGKVNACEGWDNGSLDDPIAAVPHRANHSGVWTGTEMIAWGGHDGTSYVNTGERYDPALDVVRAISVARAPAGRGFHGAVWTGSHMIVWGGFDGSASLGDGARYDPATDRWRPISQNGAPSPRMGPTAVWTGTRMIVWGGDPLSFGTRLDTGGIYNPSTDSWTATSMVNAPLGRAFHTGVWTGSRMIVWGGQVELFGATTNTGGRFDPQTNSWQATSTVNAPSARVYPHSVWTGSRMIVWGGEFDNSGGLYDPIADVWEPTSLVNVPSQRSYSTAIWTGSVMVVWGGRYNGALNTGGRYDPVANSWLPTSTIGAPLGTDSHTAIWTGSEMIVWGGGVLSATVPAAGRYDPVTDQWRGAIAGRRPAGRQFHTAVWTGTEMIVWGGSFGTIALDSGGRYDPVLDKWVAVSTVGAPAGRTAHTAVWTGDEMIVWGGLGDSGLLDTGGRYDPVNDVWEQTALAGAPTGRYQQTAVWTGSHMIVWGGTHDIGGSFTPTTNTGGRYNPSTDTWTATSLVNAPLGRKFPTAVWTGDEMIVWGGLYDVAPANDGGRYDPLADVWAPTSVAGAPTARTFHTAVWTGQEMIVWGGRDPSNQVTGTGGRYDPASDAWVPVGDAGAPAARMGHSAVWTGEQMIVWGGSTGTSTPDYLATGGRFDPLTDGWSPTTTQGSAAPRVWHTAVWTGEQMIVWGGESFSTEVLDSGGIYNPGDVQNATVKAQTCKGRNSN